ncbi:MAG: helix-turn-helix transcriptional regulator [Clostridium sp.]|uniref:helix-turn-helix transcriptional regulator n=1 Tax=Clostridium sp. TaxID=1506 RepID=UPI003EE79075
MNLKKYRKVKALRVGKGIAAKDFARKIGISVSTLRRIENNLDVNPKRNTMEKIADLLESDVTSLFFSDEMKVDK